MSDEDAPEELTVPEPADKTEAAGRTTRRRTVRRLSIAGVAVGLAAVGGFAYTQLKPVVDAQRYATVTYEVPTAPKLTPTAGETLLRVDPTRSSLTYEVDEELGGRKTGTAKGTTSGIAGDVALNQADLARTRMGRIVVNIEQFESDNNLRDARIRQDFLQSNEYPLATFDLDKITGLTGEVEEGKTYEFTIDGKVTVKGKPATVTWDATARWEGGELVATATTVAKLSRFDAGPISIAGLVQTRDDVKLTLKLTAVDPSTTDVATAVEREARQERTGTGVPSYVGDIEPILERNCVSCHQSGQFGAHTLTLDDAGDAKAVSDGIKTVTQVGYMPPWFASDKGVDLAHKPDISDEEIASLAAWAEAGAPLDVPATTKLEPTREAAELLPRQDQKMFIPSYTGSADVSNDYRCFVLEPEIAESMFMTGYTFLGDQVAQLHHAQVFHISGEQRENVRSKEGADGSPGWSCYSSPSLPGRPPDRDPGEPRHRDVGFAGQANLVAGWVPGQSPVIFPENAGFLMDPGDALVLQIHYHYGDEPVADRSGLAIQLTPDTPDIREMRVVNPLAPVEVPCLPEDADAPLCDRDAAMEENVRLYGPSGAGTQNGLLMLCGRTPDELAATFDGRFARSWCDLVVPEDGVITGVLGHMHTIGSTLRMTLDADTPAEQILLDIPDWSFDWQMNYALAKPLRVKAGQPLRLECSWDRAKAAGREPKYIMFAEGTEDEMCFATYSLIPDRQDR
ncbi:MAG: YceI family protein [Microthrixaceae bacterium]|nr:YceI family protein [Acidimicrobiales bacterium]MCB9403476.1 YceI family protein [Microthrixaceae bacterium]